MILVVLGAIAIGSLAQQATSTLFVRVVDSHRSPLPGLSVRIGEVLNCATLTASEANSRLALTKADGSVEVAVASDRVYLVTVEPQGGLEAGQGCLERMGPGRPMLRSFLGPICHDKRL
jgi:hypothetical protein